jgi:hypothetical protein
MTAQSRCQARKSSLFQALNVTSRYRTAPSPQFSSSATFDPLSITTRHGASDRNRNAFRRSLCCKR